MALSNFLMVMRPSKVQGMFRDAEELVGMGTADAGAGVVTAVGVG